jgi:hypothetical protein
MGRSSLEWLCFFMLLDSARFVPAAHLDILYAAGILAPGYGRFTEAFRSRTCGPSEPARLAPAASSAVLICRRCHAREVRLVSGTPLTDRTGQEWSIHESRGRRSREFRPFDLSDLSARSSIGRGKSLAHCFDSGYHPRGSRIRTKDAARPGPLADVPGHLN